MWRWVFSISNLIACSLGKGQAEDKPLVSITRVYAGRAPFIAFGFIALHGYCSFFFFYKLKASHSRSKKITTCFITVVWNQTHRISEVCPQKIWAFRFMHLF